MTQREGGFTVLRKTIPLAASRLAIKADDGGPGQLVGYASVWNGIDAYGDTIVKGAYRDTIPSFVARGTLHSEHDTRLRLGTIKSAEEDDHGLLIVADFYSDPEAQRVRQQIAERWRGVRRLSIGYVPELRVPRCQLSEEPPFRVKGPGCQPHPTA
jgi:HK97 family phage prohead protease